jgi:hypothetical protein
MLGGFTTVNHHLDFLDELGEEVACHLAGFFQIFNLLCIFDHKALIKEVESIHLGMRLPLQILRELLSYLPRFCITQNHTNFRRRDRPMQLRPDLSEGSSGVFSFSQQGKVVLLGIGVIPQIGEKGDCVRNGLPFLSEAYMMMAFCEMAMMVSAKLYPAKNQLTMAMVFSLPPFPLPLTRTRLSMS